MASTSPASDFLRLSPFASEYLRLALFGAAFVSVWRAAFVSVRRCVYVRLARRVCVRLALRPKQKGPVSWLFRRNLLSLQAESIGGPRPRTA